MKKILFLFLFVVIANAGYSQTPHSICLNLKGFVKDVEGPIKNVVVELYEENTLITSVKTPASGRFSFNLSEGHHYTLLVQHRGFVTEKVSVNTTLPFSRSESILNIFDFDMVLEESARFNTSAEVFDFPVALIYYNEDIETFDYSAKYLESVRKEWGKSRQALSGSKKGDMN